MTGRSYVGCVWPVLEGGRAEGRHATASQGSYHTFINYNCLTLSLAPLCCCCRSILRPLFDNLLDSDGKAVLGQGDVIMVDTSEVPAVIFILPIEQCPNTPSLSLYFYLVCVWLGGWDDE